MFVSLNYNAQFSSPYDDENISIEIFAQDHVFCVSRRPLNSNNNTSFAAVPVKYNLHPPKQMIGTCTDKTVSKQTSDGLIKRLKLAILPFNTDVIWSLMRS